MAGIDWLNGIDEAQALEAFLRCCGSRRFARAMVARRPFSGTEALLSAADEVWFGLSRDDWLEAFGHHPRIGDVAELERRFASTATWARGEQSGAAGASRGVLEDLAEGNRTYERRFGHIFIVCATGKTADDMLAALRTRLANDPATELASAAREQAMITRLRLEKL